MRTTFWTIAESVFSAAASSAGGRLPLLSSASNRKLRGINRAMLWLSVALVASFASFTYFPNYAVGSGGVGNNAQGQEIETLVLGVRGMTCAGCENSVEQALSDVQGVVAVIASYPEETAVVRVERATVPSRAAFAAALGQAGYELASMAGEAAPRKPSLSGHWVAEVLMSDRERVGLVVDLDRLGSRWVGEFDVAEFGVENYPVEVTLSAPVVKLHFAGPDADFDGKLSEDGKSISGLLDLGEDPIRTQLRRTGEPQFSETFLQLEAAADDPSLVESLSADATGLRRRFNADQDKTRLLMLLSPT